MIPLAPALAALPPLFGGRLAERLAQLQDVAQSMVTPASAPRVLIVPGLPGTRLGRRGALGDEIVWFDPLTARAGHLVDLAVDPSAPSLEPLGVLEAVYMQLYLRLRCAGYDVGFYPFDWRRSLADLGPELASHLRGEPGEVHLVCHSFGGMVARAALASGATNIGKMIFLGTPSEGTFAVVQGLRGNHWLLRLLSAFDGHRTAAELSDRAFNTFPSVYEQLPTPRVFQGLDLLDPLSWPAGPRLRPELLAGVPRVQSIVAATHGRVAVIAGHGHDTVDDLSLEDGVFRYARTTAGDGWVPVRHARVEGAIHYFAPCSHVGLTNSGQVIRAVEDLLSGDHTDRLPTTCPPGERLPPQSDNHLPPEPFDGRRGSDLTLDDLRELGDQIFGTDLGAL